MIKEETITRYDELEIDKKYQEGMSTTFYYKRCTDKTC